MWKVLSGFSCRPICRSDSSTSIGLRTLRLITPVALFLALLAAPVVAAPLGATIEYQPMASSGLAAGAPFESWVVFNISSNPTVPGMSLPAGGDIPFHFSGGHYAADRTCSAGCSPLRLATKGRDRALHHRVGSARYAHDCSQNIGSLSHHPAGKARLEEALRVSKRGTPDPGKNPVPDFPWRKPGEIPRVPGD